MVAPRFVIPAEAGIQAPLNLAPRRRPTSISGPPYWQQRRTPSSRPPGVVEKVFGTLKRSYGYQRVRYRGLGRNAVELWFKLMAYNLRKADTLAWGAA